MNFKQVFFISGISAVSSVSLLDMRRPTPVGTRRDSNPWFPPTGRERLTSQHFPQLTNETLSNNNFDKFKLIQINSNRFNLIGNSPTGRVALLRDAFDSIDTNRSNPNVYSASLPSSSFSSSSSSSLPNLRSFEPSQDGKASWIVLRDPAIHSGGIESPQGRSLQEKQL